MTVGEATRPGSPGFDWLTFARELAGRTPSERSPGAEGALVNARRALEQEELERESVERKRSRRLWRALCLAPSLEVFEALAHGAAVPLDRLDPEWVRRLGRRSP